jgi:hypothetical protein
MLRVCVPVPPFDFAGSRARLHLLTTRYSILSAHVRPRPPRAHLNPFQRHIASGSGSFCLAAFGKVTLFTLTPPPYSKPVIPSLLRSYGYQDDLANQTTQSLLRQYANTDDCCSCECNMHWANTPPPPPPPPASCCCCCLAHIAAAQPLVILPLQCSVEQVKSHDRPPMNAQHNQHF